MKNKLLTILSLKCPKCSKSHPYTHPIYKITKLLSMHERCLNCNLKFEIEPGFFYGAMYIAYGLTVFLAGIIVGLVTLGIRLAYDDLNSTFEVWGFLGLKNLILCILGGLLISMPYTSKLSRIVWLSFFVDKKK